MAHRLVLLLGFCACSATALASLLESEQIRTYLVGLDVGAEPFIGEHRLHNPGLLASLYRHRNHEPISTSGGPLAEAKPALLRAVALSATHGLAPADYHDRALRALAGRATNRVDGTDPNLALELLASDAFLQQVRHRSSGAVSPRELDPDWHFIPPEVDPVQTLATLAARGHPLEPPWRPSGRSMTNTSSCWTNGRASWHSGRFTSNPCHRGRS